MNKPVCQHFFPGGGKKSRPVRGGGSRSSARGSTSSAGVPPHPRGFHLIHGGSTSSVSADAEAPSPRRGKLWETRAPQGEGIGDPRPSRGRLWGERSAGGGTSSGSFGPTFPSRGRLWGTRLSRGRLWRPAPLKGEGFGGQRYCPRRVVRGEVRSARRNAAGIVIRVRFQLLCTTAAEARNRIRFGRPS